MKQLSKHNVLAIGDTHLPFSHRDYLAFCVATRKKYNCGTVVHIGDLVDNHSISYHEHDPNGWAPLREMEETDKHLARWFKAFPELILVRGNHDCQSVETEILSEVGWKRVYEYEGERLANFDIETGEIRYDLPLAFIPPHLKPCVCIEGKNTKQVVSYGHDVVVDGKKVKAKKLIGKTFPSRQIRRCGNYSATGAISDFDLQLMFWVIFDGTIVISSPGKKRLQFKLSKQRKIDHLIDLLVKNDCPYTLRKATKSGINKLQPYYITVYGEKAREICLLLDNTKEVPRNIRFLNTTQCKLVHKVVEATDGSRGVNTVSIVSVSKKNLDRLQLMYIHNNVPATVKSIGFKSGFENGKEQYQLTVQEAACFKERRVTCEAVGEKEVFGFTMPLGTMVTRHSGKVAFTGNCLHDRKGKTAGLPKRAFRDFRAIWNLPVYWKDVFEIELYNVLYKHGLGFSGQLAHLHAAFSARQSTVIGHLHSVAGVDWIANSRDCVFGMSVGCGIDRRSYAFAYGKDFKKKPILGAGVILDKGRYAQFIPMQLDWLVESAPGS